MYLYIYLLLAHDLSKKTLKCEPEWEFECQDHTPGGHRSCIPRALVCDGVKDCKDGSDEKFDLCVNPPCRNSTKFRCKSGLCISNLLRCNKQFDCLDKSDEDHCDYGK